MPLRRRVLLLRVAIIITLVVVWEAVAASGLLFRDVVPSLLNIGKAMISILTVADHMLSSSAPSTSSRISTATSG
jgi:ABC-type nitrate/sulfonate/bicarbonate transport system permease component